MNVEEKYLECKKSARHLRKEQNATKDMLCDLSERYILADEEGKEDIAKEFFPFLMEHAQCLQTMVGRATKTIENLVETLMVLYNRRK